MSDMIPGSRWQETELEYAVKGTSARLIEAEAAIARVREVADRVARYHGDGLPCIKPRDIYRALDGER